MSAEKIQEGQLKVLSAGYQKSNHLTFYN